MAKLCMVAFCVAIFGITKGYNKAKNDEGVGQRMFISESEGAIPIQSSYSTALGEVKPSNHNEDYGDITGFDNSYDLNTYLPPSKNVWNTGHGHGLGQSYLPTSKVVWQSGHNPAHGKRWSNRYEKHGTTGFGNYESLFKDWLNPKYGLIDARAMRLKNVLNNAPKSYLDNEYGSNFIKFDKKYNKPELNYQHEDLGGFLEDILEEDNDPNVKIQIVKYSNNNQPILSKQYSIRRKVAQEMNGPYVSKRIRIIKTIPDELDIDDDISVNNILAGNKYKLLDDSSNNNFLKQDKQRKKMAKKYEKAGKVEVRRILGNKPRKNEIVKRFFFGKGGDTPSGYDKRIDELDYGFGNGGRQSSCDTSGFCGEYQPGIPEHGYGYGNSGRNFPICCYERPEFEFRNRERNLQNCCVYTGHGRRCCIFSYGQMKPGFGGFENGFGNWNTGRSNNFGIEGRRRYPNNWDTRRSFEYEKEFGFGNGRSWDTRRSPEYGNEYGYGFEKNPNNWDNMKRPEYGFGNGERIPQGWDTRTKPEFGFGNEGSSWDTKTTPEFGFGNGGSSWDSKTTPEFGFGNTGNIAETWMKKEPEKIEDNMFLPSKTRLGPVSKISQTIKKISQIPVNDFTTPRKNSYSSSTYTYNSKYSSNEDSNDDSIPISVIRRGPMKNDKEGAINKKLINRRNKLRKLQPLDDE